MSSRIFGLFRFIILGLSVQKVSSLECYKNHCSNANASACMTLDLNKGLFSHEKCFENEVCSKEIMYLKWTDHLNETRISVSVKRGCVVHQSSTGLNECKWIWIDFPTQGWGTCLCDTDYCNTGQRTMEACSVIVLLMIIAFVRQ